MKSKRLDYKIDKICGNDKADQFGQRQNDRLFLKKRLEALYGLFADRRKD